MYPSLTADPATMISWSLSNNRPTHFFTARLGLPQKKSNKNEKDRAIFDGDLALRSTALYRSILEIRRALIIRFGTKQGLRGVEERQRHTLITEVTDLLFAIHGPLIWSASPPFLTVIDEANYPKHLKHNDSSDHERIILYLYCRTISQLPRSKPRKSSGGRRTNTRTSRVHDLSDCDDDNDCIDDDDCDDGIDYDGCDDCDDAPDVDTEPLEMDDHVGHSSARVSHELDDAYHVPVAQMLSKNVLRDPNMDGTGRLRRVTAKAPLEQEPAGEKPTQVSDDNNENLDLYLPPSPASRTIKRRGYSTRDHGQNKKQKGDGEKSADNADVLSSPHNQTLRNETGAWRQCLDSYPSPPTVQQEPSSNIRNMRNFPNVTHAEQAMADESDTDVVQNAPVSTEETQAENATENPGLEDGDSVQGAEQVESSNVIPEPRRLVVPIRLTAQSKDTEDLRRRLGSNLLDVLPAGLECPDLPLLSHTIEVVQLLTKVDHLCLREIYHNDFNSFHGALDQWVKCLKLLFQFCQLTEFEGDLASRYAFVNDMPIKLRVEAVRILSRGGSFLSQWHEDEEMAKKVATMLSDLVWPQSW